MKEEDTRERIINAAKEVFSKKGYSGSTTKEISTVAEVAEITLFRHFETKNNLFMEVILKFLVNPILTLNISNLNDAEKVLQKIIEERSETLRNNKDLFICTIYESQFNDEIKDMIKRIFLKVISELTFFLIKDEMKKDEEDIVDKAYILLFTIIGSIIFEYLTGSDTLKGIIKLNETIKILSKQ